MANIILIRHGQSKWNLQNKFTGWKDIDLSENGINEAKEAGQLIKQNNIKFNIAFTSVLKRAINTMNIVLKENSLTDIQVIQTYRLNERHYGGLTGLNKKETAEIHGEEQVHKWRRSYKTKPPKSSEEFMLSIKKDNKYTELDQIPYSESLEDTVKRVSPFIKTTLINALKKNENILIAAHGNSIRAFLKITEKISDTEISKLEIPTGKPLLVKYNLHNYKFSSHEYLK
tara:strand:+ start:7705 stop:8391 length:687 start_codon:yes stop_codon:yes gene_type:complete